MPQLNIMPQLATSYLIDNITTPLDLLIILIGLTLLIFSVIFAVYMESLENVSKPELDTKIKSKRNNRRDVNLVWGDFPSGVNYLLNGRIETNNYRECRIFYSLSDVSGESIRDIDSGSNEFIKVCINGVNTGCIKKVQAPVKPFPVSMGRQLGISHRWWLANTPTSRLSSLGVPVVPDHMQNGVFGTTSPNVTSYVPPARRMPISDVLNPRE